MSATLASNDLVYKGKRMRRTLNNLSHIGKAQLSSCLDSRNFSSLGFPYREHPIISVSLAPSLIQGSTQNFTLAGRHGLKQPLLSTEGAKKPSLASTMASNNCLGTHFNTQFLSSVEQTATGTMKKGDVIPTHGPEGSLVSRL